MDTNKKRIEIFQDLLHITNDRLRGYEKVKETIGEHEPTVQQWFESLQQQTYHMQNEIMEHIGELGGEFDQDGTILGAIHRAWIDVKNTFSSDDDKAESTLENVIFGEKAAKRAYEEANKNEALGGRCKEIITSHLSKINESLKQAEELEEKFD